MVTRASRDADGGMEQTRVGMKERLSKQAGDTDEDMVTLRAQNSTLAGGSRGEKNTDRAVPKAGSMNNFYARREIRKINQRMGKDKCRGIRAGRLWLERIAERAWKRVRKVMDSLSHTKAAGAEYRMSRYYISERKEVMAMMVMLYHLISKHEYILKRGSEGVRVNLEE